MIPPLTTLAMTALKKGADYIKDDRTSFYALNVQRWVALKGRGIGVGIFEFDGFRIISEKGGGLITLVADPFAVESKKWFGPLWLPDTMKDGSFEASLWASLLIYNRDRIISALKIKPANYDRWVHSIYIAAWKGYAAALYPGAKLNDAKQYFAFNAAQWESWVRRVIGKVGAALAVVILCVSLTVCSGCSTPTAYEMVGFGDGAPPVPELVVDGDTEPTP